MQGTNDLTKPPGELVPRCSDAGQRCRASSRRESGDLGSVPSLALFSKPGSHPLGAPTSSSELLTECLLDVGTSSLMPIVQMRKLRPRKGTCSRSHKGGRGEPRTPF